MENIQEVVTELENQPETNLLPEEVEEKFSQLMVRRGGEEEGKGGGEGEEVEEKFSQLMVRKVREGREQGHGRGGGGRRREGKEGGGRREGQKI